MILRPPRSTRTDTLFPYTTLFRSVALGEAGSVPASHSIIADYYPPEKRVTALALWGLALPAGIMLGYASGGWIAAALGWRLAFGVIGVAGLDRKSTRLNSSH